MPLFIYWCCIGLEPQIESDRIIPLEICVQDCILKFVKKNAVTFRTDRKKHPPALITAVHSLKIDFKMIRGVYFYAVNDNILALPGCGHYKGYSFFLQLFVWIIYNETR